jgi:predicted RNA-binding Zn-ribbon protein involved in translation (DUF1610 family)
MAMIRLMTCYSIFEAYQIKDKLEAEGIACFLTNENFSSLLPNYSGVMGSGVHIMIEETSLKQASEVIKPDKSESVIACPNCNSTEIAFSIGEKPLGKVLVIILSLLIWIPFGNIKKTYLCKKCGTRFKI